MLYWQSCCGAAHGRTKHQALHRTQLLELMLYCLQGNRDSINTVATSGLDVFAHNVETVERLQRVVRDRRANWRQSLGVLTAAKEAGVQITKTSIMLGCGEHTDEVSGAPSIQPGASLSAVGHHYLVLRFRLFSWLWYCWDVCSLCAVTCALVNLLQIVYSALSSSCQHGHWPCAVYSPSTLDFCC